MPRMIYLTGQPGAGKSTLMAALTEGLSRVSYEPPEVTVAHDVLVHPVTQTVLGAEIGRRREHFSGTDTLPSSVIEKAIPWVKTVPFDLLVGEGARLGNKRFLLAALEAGYHVDLVLLDHTDADTWRKQQSKKIGHDHSPAWVRNRLTVSRTLADQLLGRDNVTEYRGHPDEVLEQLAPLISVNA